MICSSLDAQLPYSTLSPGDGTKSLPLSSNMAACRQFTSKERVGENYAGEILDADVCLASGKDDADVDCICFPEAFLGGSAPRFQTFLLNGIPFPRVSELCPLVNLFTFDWSLEMIPDSGYISLE